MLGLLKTLLAVLSLAIVARASCETNKASAAALATAIFDEDFDSLIALFSTNVDYYGPAFHGSDIFAKVDHDDLESSWVTDYFDNVDSTNSRVLFNQCANDDEDIVILVITSDISNANTRLFDARIVFELHFGSDDLISESWVVWNSLLEASTGGLGMSATYASDFNTIAKSGSCVSFVSAVRDFQGDIASTDAAALVARYASPFVVVDESFDFPNAFVDESDATDLQSSWQWFFDNLNPTNENIEEIHCLADGHVYMRVSQDVSSSYCSKSESHSFYIFELDNNNDIVMQMTAFNSYLEGSMGSSTCSAASVLHSGVAITLVAAAVVLALLG